MTAKSACVDETAGVLVHGTCVAVGALGILLRGSSGSGKSDLALRLISQPWPLRLRAPAEIAIQRARLVADDQVRLLLVQGRLVARAPATIAGKLEVRGIGIVEAEVVAEAVLALVVDLMPSAQIERMPASDLTTEVLGLAVPLIQIDPFQSSAPAKIAVALARVGVGQ